MVFLRRLLREHAVRRENDVVRGADADHVHGVAGQLQHFQTAESPEIRFFYGSYRRGFRHQEFVAQLFGGIAAVEHDRLQDGMTRDSRCDGGAEDGCSGAVRDELVAADVVRMQVGVDDRLERPALGIQGF